LKQAMVATHLVADSNEAQLEVDSRIQYKTSSTAYEQGATANATYETVWGTKTLEQAIVELGVIVDANQLIASGSTGFLENKSHTDMWYVEDITDSLGNTGSTGSVMTSFGSLFGDKTIPQSMSLVTSLLKRQGLLAQDLTGVPTINEAYRMKVDGVDSLKTFSSVVQPYVDPPRSIPT
jgi:hypothetical protein